MQVNIIIFGQIADITGTNNLTLSNVNDTDELLQKLKIAYPALHASKFVVAVDKKVVKENTALYNNNTIALLPPFSGG
jgi:molybdopterin synthase sulfur carrier subunit